MIALSVDTSGDRLAVTLTGDVKDEIYLGDAMLKHSVTLMPSIEQILTENGLTLNDIDVFAAVTGPGSFTGIRIGVSAAKALAYANDKKVLAVTSFDLLAYNGVSDKKLCVIDALHGNFYACGYDGEKVILKPCFITLQEVKKLGAEYKIIADKKVDGEAFIVGDMLAGLKNAVNAKIGEATLDRETLIPLYVRKSQAEENAK